MAFDTSSYDLMKKSKQQEALDKKNNTISQLQIQQGGIENSYKDLADTLAKRKADLAAKNVADNQSIDTQLQTGNQNYLNQRDQGVVANSNQSKALMDWYAKNNIANSTASADELGRQATVLANTLGTINSNKNQFENNIANTRNLTNLDYNNGLNDITNQDNAAQREKAQKLAEILNSIAGADNTYNSELQSINDSVEAQKLQDLNAYNERLRQEQVAAQQAEADRQFQAQQAALSRAASARTASASKAPSATQQRQAKQDNAQQLTNQVQMYLDSWASGNTDQGRATRSDMINYVRQNADTLLNQGVNAPALVDWIRKNYTWDKNSSGEWYDTAS